MTFPAFILYNIIYYGRFYFEKSRTVLLLLNLQVVRKSAKQQLVFLNHFAPGHYKRLQWSWAQTLNTKKHVHT